jgi:hypothetical protein
MLQKKEKKRKKSNKNKQKQKEQLFVPPPYLGVPVADDVEDVVGIQFVAAQKSRKLQRPEWALWVGLKMRKQEHISKIRKRSKKNEFFVSKNTRYNETKHRILSILRYLAWEPVDLVHHHVRTDFAPIQRRNWLLAQKSACKRVLSIA